MSAGQRRPNARLRAARGGRSQAAVAEAVNAEIERATGRTGALSAKSISDLECGWYTWPARPTRDALCAVLGVDDPGAIGLTCRRSRHPVPTAGGTTVLLGTDSEEEMDPLRRRTFLLGGAAVLGGQSLAGPDASTALPVRAEDRYGFAAAVSERWPDTRIGRPIPDRGIDWALELPGGRAFGGAVTEVQVHAASARSGELATVAAEPRRLALFARSRQRTLLVAADDTAEGSTFYAVDGREARRQAGRWPKRHSALIPRAYLLDDLTYGALWAAANLDHALLDDDNPLHEHRRDMAQYEGLDRSAVDRDEAADLGAVSTMWLGSDFCARHILRNLDRLNVAPLFWTREQRGEEASAWLFYRHKLAYLRRTSHPADATTRGFCIPESAVRDSPRHERALLFLAAALMEAHGIRVRVTADAAYSEVDGFVLGGRAIVANWVRTPGIWAVDTTASVSQRATFADAAAHITTRSLIEAPSPGGRLVALADYLGLPWCWLRERCAQLGAAGFDRLLRPRSRLLTADGLTHAARYVGGIPTT